MSPFYSGRLKSKGKYPYISIHLLW